jgi:fumarate hydratase class II
VFKHFPNKDAIWQAAMLWVRQELLAALQAAADAAATPLQALQAVFHAHVAFVISHPGVPRFIFQELQQPTESAAKTGTKSGTKPGTKTRIESDSMGEMHVQADLLHGATTQRAVLNFPVSGRTVPPAVIAAYLERKRACAMANLKLKELPRDKADAIVASCERLLEDFADRRAEVMRHFPIDVYQTGSGTSTNMNVNEVIANTASLMRGKKIGSKDPLHPNDHVNYGQSSNDTFPTAMQVAGAVAIDGQLVPALKRLHRALDAKAKAWDRHVKIGRTHLMDATPIRVGQVFSGYAAAVAYAVARADALEQMYAMASGIITSQKSSI